jgi:MFS family permease
MNPISYSQNKKGLFYGWYIVAGLATISMVSVGMGGMNLGLFVRPLHDELGISQQYIGWSQTARLIGFSLSSWFIGRLLDEYGARIPMAVASVIMLMIMGGLSMLQTGWQLVALIFFSGMIGLEGGGGNLYQSVPLSRWFIHKRGKAMSISFFGTTLGLLIFTPLIQAAILYVDWRFAWRVIGCGSCLVIFIIAVSVIRKDPYSMGLYPDGLSPDESHAFKEKGNIKSDIEAVEHSWTREQALRSFAFWGMTLIMGLRMLATSTLNVFRIPYYIESGFSPMLVSFAISIEAIVSAVIAVLTGMAMDRFHARHVVSASLVALILVFIVTIHVRTEFDIFLATSLYGVAASSFMVSTNTLWPNYFGSKHIGNIRGFAIPFTTIFGSLGAPVTGRIKDLTGSYIHAWIVAIFILVAAAVLMLYIKKPDNPDAENN